MRLIGKEVLLYKKHWIFLFVYLCYDPRRIDLVDEQKGNEIRAVYETTCTEFRAIEFKELLASIAAYLRGELQIGTATAQEIEVMVSHFEIVWCDQCNWREYIG